MKRFATTVTMKVTKEDFENHLQEELVKLGYSINDIFDFYKYVVTNFGGKNKHVGMTNNLIKRFGQGPLALDYNTELFLALAAMTEGEDWIVGEYLVFKDTNTIFRVNEIRKGAAMSAYGIVGQGKKHIYRKATKEEIINYFKNGMIDNPKPEENVFPDQWAVQVTKENREKVISLFHNIVKPGKDYPFSIGSVYGRYINDKGIKRSITLSNLPAFKRNHPKVRLYTIDGLEYLLNREIEFKFPIVLKYKDAQLLIKAVNKQAKHQLALKWGYKIATQSTIEISEGLYNKIKDEMKVKPSILNTVLESVK